MSEEFEKLYSLICGFVDLTNAQSEDEDDLNIFKPDMPCQQLSKSAYDARLRLEARLLSEDDDDVLTLVNAHEEMQKLVAHELYTQIISYSSL